MFILRRLSSKGYESNTILNESYSIIAYDHDDFQKLLKNFENTTCELEIWGFIIYDEGSKTIPLYKKSYYYVMCSNGQTFANITRQ